MKKKICLFIKYINNNNLFLIYYIYTYYIYYINLYKFIF